MLRSLLLLEETSEPGASEEEAPGSAFAIADACRAAGASSTVGAAEEGAVPLEVDPRELLLSLSVGLGLAAACGFRIFVPLLALGIGARTELVPLASGFEWLATTPALGAFSVATALEIGAYYIPWLDNALDVAATPAAVAAGALASASVLTDVSPLLRWSVALVGGGTAAGVVQGATSLLRFGSTATTGGVANHAVATGEWIAASVVAALAILLPVLALVVIGAIVFGIYRLARRAFRHASVTP